MQGNIVAKMMMFWKDFVVTQKNLRRAVGLFQNGLLMRCFRKLVVYWQGRLRGYRAKEAAEEHLAASRLRSGFALLFELISPERKAYKRHITKAIAWFRDASKVKAYTLWVTYVKDIKRCEGRRRRKGGRERLGLD
jgi:hypothetical protein